MASDVADRVQAGYESPWPECRVMATAEPFAILRLDMRRERAVEWVEEVQHAVDEYDGNGLVTLGVTMPEPTYKAFADQVDTLVQASQSGSGFGDDDVAAAQVVLDRDLEPGDPGVSVGVILNNSQVIDIWQKAGWALSASVENVHRWEFSCSYAGGQILVQQLIAACNGADDPLDHVDSGEVDDAE